MKTISITIPFDVSALLRASDMLLGIANDISKETASVQSWCDGTKDEVTPEETQALNEPEAAAIFAAPNVDVMIGVDTAPSSTDANTLVPWDHRIHASTKGKLAKAPNGWKMKRGVDEELVVQVEAELRAAMAAGYHVDETKERIISPASAFPPEVDNQGPREIATAPAMAGTVTTFPALMAAITANDIDQTAVTAAVNAQGLASLPLLASRPDLIPAVAAALGL